MKVDELFKKHSSCVAIHFQEDEWLMNRKQFEEALKESKIQTRVRCQSCGRDGAKRRRQGTAYVEDEKNFATLCKRCQIKNDEYWDEMNQEYINILK